MQLPDSQRLFRIILIHLLISIHTVLSLLQGYNEPCELYDETSSCDDTIGLMCIDSGVKGYRCKCPNGDNQFSTLYESKRNRCVGKVFNTCVRSSGLHTKSIANNMNDNSNGNNNGTLFHCVENAECNTAVYYLPICLCKKGYFETDEGMCSVVAKFGQSCDNDKSQCDSKYGLTCLPDGKCGCKDTSNQFYDSQEEKCITYVGGNCSVEEPLCVPHAECTKISKFPMSMPKRTIIFGSEEVKKNAEPSFSLDGNSPTYRGPGGSPLSQTHANSDAYSAKCMCQSGYSPTKNGYCMKSYASICKMLERNNTEICNPDQFLECLDGHDGNFRCQCRNPLNERWDQNKKECVSMIGKKCRPFQSYPKCEAGGECINETCHCKKGTTLTQIGGCKLDYNERCLPGECNIYMGLTCHGKTASCLCLDSYLKYDPKKKACVAGLGSPCGNVQMMGIDHSGHSGTTIRGLSGLFPINNRYHDSNVGVHNGNGNYNNGNNSNDDTTPFIGCEEGTSCTAQIAGKRMLHVCTTSTKS